MTGTDPHRLAIAAFDETFGGPPDLIIRSPGRVNLIGEHTDYNDGFVLPMAIDRWTVLAISPRTDRVVDVTSAGFGRVSFGLDGLRHGGPEWIEYLKGMAWSLGEPLAGWNGAIAGNIPLGASLSSSASLEIAAALAFVSTADRPWDPVAGALAAQRAENEWVGVHSGIMDQLAITTAKSGRAQLLDCRSLDRKAVPLPETMTVVVLDTATRRSLTNSEYNTRREECNAAARAFGVPSLRDLDVATVMDPPSGIDPTLLRRARHVVTENERTLQAVDALSKRDLPRFGWLIDESHRSLRDDFEVSSPALDAIVDAAGTSEGCLGARMTGAGFAGCAIAIVTASSVDSFSASTAEKYRAVTGADPAIHPCRPVDGAAALDNPFG